jgi:hypothetical protein
VDGLRGLKLRETPTIAVLDHASLLDLADALDAQLADSSVDALEKMTVLAAQPLPAAVSEQLDAMRLLVEDFDFDEARALLATVRSLLNESAAATG